MVKKYLNNETVVLLINKVKIRFKNYYNYYYLCFAHAQIVIFIFPLGNTAR